jgi:formamidopyrimidine-DNA glycosylase
MTGKWIRRRAEDPKPAHVRASLTLDDGTAVDYRDMRLFGRLIRGKTEKLRESPALSALGPDPLSGIDVDRLHSILVRTKRSMKEALMDQRTLAGLGNIYVDEALWYARLNPLRPAGGLDVEELRRLNRGIRKALRLGIERQGASLRDYSRPDGGSGGMQDEFRVYGRDGMPCGRCRTVIAKTRVGGRGTHYCPRCQPELEVAAVA